MIQVNNGYILTEAQTTTTTFQDTVTAVSRPIMAPSSTLIANSQGNTIPAWETLNEVYPLVAYNGIIGSSYEAAKIRGAGPITVDALHKKANTGVPYVGDFIRRFRWYAVWVGSVGVNPGWDWYRIYSDDGGTNWSEPVRVGEHVYDRDQDPTKLESFFCGTAYMHPSEYHISYGGNDCPVMPLCSILFGYNSASYGSDSFGDFYVMLGSSPIQTNPVANNDYIHTVTAVVT